MVCKTALIIVTNNNAGTLERHANMIAIQTLQPTDRLIIDSSLGDDAVTKAKFYGFECHKIKPNEFNHGTTRQLALELLDVDVYVFMTQDAVFVDENSFANIVAAFADKQVGCAYGRQLPNKNADILEEHARKFNYPVESIIKSYADRERLGIKVCFNSDSFAAYRKAALQEIGGFPRNIILGEDMYVAAKMLMQGWKSAYQADALVYHSHRYSIIQEFKRYFDIGVCHAMNHWLLQNFRHPCGEGIKFVKSEFSYCLRYHAYFALLRSAATVCAKFIGYTMGRHFSIMPLRIRRKLSMNSFYWK